jgi:hypothetical protein
MEIQFANQNQVKIADLMWEADSKDEVDKIISIFGHDAIVVFQMITAATFDEVGEVDIAKEILDRIFQF